MKADLEGFHTWRQMNTSEEEKPLSWGSQGKKLSQGSNEPLRWSTWHIQSAMQYEQEWLPEICDEGFLKTLSL